MNINLKNEFWEAIERSPYPFNKATKGAENFEESLKRYLTLLYKHIPERKYDLRYTAEFAQEMEEGHSKKEAINRIHKLLEDGEDANFFLGQRIEESEFHDYLRYCWNIYHFHLNLKEDPKTGFAKKADRILFCYIEGNLAIFLGTDKHRQGKAFGDEDWLRRLRKNFPEVLEPYKIPDAVGLTHNPTIEERIEAWDKGVNIMIDLDGEVFSPPGLGLMTSGDSSLVMKEVVAVQRWIEKSEEVLCNNFRLIMQELGIEHEEPEIKIGISEHGPLIYEAKTMKSIVQYPYCFGLKY